AGAASHHEVDGNGEAERTSSDEDPPEVLVYGREPRAEADRRAGREDEEREPVEPIALAMAVGERYAFLDAPWDDQRGHEERGDEDREEERADSNLAWGEGAEDRGHGRRERYPLPGAACKWRAPSSFEWESR